MMRSKMMIMSLQVPKKTRMKIKAKNKRKSRKILIMQSIKYLHSLLNLEVRNLILLKLSQNSNKMHRQQPKHKLVTIRYILLDTRLKDLAASKLWTVESTSSAASLKVSTFLFQFQLLITLHMLFIRIQDTGLIDITHTTIILPMNSKESGDQSNIVG